MSLRHLVPLGGFDPTLLTGKIVLYIADPANIVLSGSDVTQINDLSGTGKHGTWGTSKGLYVSGGLNGQGYLNLPANNPTRAFRIGTGTETIWQASRGHFVYQVWRQLSTTDDSIFLTGRLDSQPNYPCYDWKSGEYLFAGDHTDMPEKARFQISAPGTTNFHRSLFSYNGSGFGTASNHSCWQDGTLVTTVAGTYLQYGSRNVVASYEMNTAQTFSMPLDLAFLVICDHAITTQERNSLDAWVFAKYGI